jgi:hypothetical protein
VRHLLITHEEREASTKADAQTALTEMHASFTSAAAAAEQQHAMLLDQERAARLAAESETARCRLECEHTLGAAIKQHECTLTAVQARYERDWLALQTATQDACAAELRAGEAKMAACMAALQAQQQLTLRDLHAQFEVHHQEHAARIAHLESESARLAESEAAAQRTCRAVTAEFAGQRDALAAVHEELAVTKRQLHVAATDASLLVSTKKRLAAADRRIREMELENEALRVQLEEGSAHHAKAAAKLNSAPVTHSVEARTF